MKKMMSFILLTFVLSIGTQSFAGDYIPRTDSREYDEELADPKTIVFAYRDSGRSMGDWAGTCETFAITYNFEEHIIDDCVAKSEYEMEKIVEKLKKTLKIAIKENKAVSIDKSGWIGDSMIKVWEKENPFLESDDE